MNEKIRMAKSTNFLILLFFCCCWSHKSILSLTLQTNQRRNHKSNWKESSRPSDKLFTNM